MNAPFASAVCGVDSAVPLTVRDKLILGTVDMPEIVLSLSWTGLMAIAGALCAHRGAVCISAAVPSHKKKRDIFAIK